MGADFGIYGESYPYIAYTGGGGLALPNAKIISSKPEWDYIVLPSRKTGHRTIRRKGAHWVFEFVYYVFKAGTLAQQHTLADTIQDLLWNGTQFYLYQHADGDAFRNAAGGGVLFQLVEFQPYPVENGLYRDAIRCKIISLDYVKVVPLRTY